MPLSHIFYGLGFLFLTLCALSLLWAKSARPSSTVAPPAPQQTSPLPADAAAMAPPQGKATQGNPAAPGGKDWDPFKHLEELGTEDRGGKP